MKKYILKPGNHQFAPCEHARHSNATITDAEAEWYLKRYPHIKSLFSNYPTADKTDTWTTNQQHKEAVSSKKNNHPKSKIRNGKTLLKAVENKP